MSSVVKFATGADWRISSLYTGAGMRQNTVSCSACTEMSNCRLFSMQ